MLKRSSVPIKNRHNGIGCATIRGDVRFCPRVVINHR